MFSNQRQKSFILLETIVSVFILIVGIIGLYTLINQSTTETNKASAKITANYLAQEGIEIARNIRDSNLLEKCYANAYKPWDDGLGDPLPSDTDCDSVTYYYEGDYNDSSLTQSDISVPSGFLNYNADGLYDYGSGSSTQFQRKIFICEKHSEVPNAKWDPTEAEPGITPCEELLPEDCPLPITPDDRAEYLTVMVKVYWQGEALAAASYQERLYNLYKVIKEVSLPTGCVPPQLPSEP